MLHFRDTGCCIYDKENVIIFSYLLTKSERTIIFFFRQKPVFMFIIIVTQILLFIKHTAAIKDWYGYEEL